MMRPLPITGPRLNSAAMSVPYYITTAINYPNGRPHIGHAYEAIAADAIARFQRQAGRDVRFQTGTDEHGLKMVQTARDRGVPVRAPDAEMSGYFQDMAPKLNFAHERLISRSEGRRVWKEIVST